MITKRIDIYCDGYDIYTDSEDIIPASDLLSVLRTHYENHFPDDFLAEQVIENWSCDDFTMVVTIFFDDDYNVVEDYIITDRQFESATAIAIVYRALLDRGMESV